MANNLNLMM